MTNATERDFPAHYEHLKGLIGRLGQRIPGPINGFGALHKEAVAPGVLDARVKELIALGIAICVRCDGCIAYHVHDALEAGAEPADIEETIGVAILMGGGPSLMYGAEALEQFQALGAP